MKDLVKQYAESMTVMVTQGSSSFRRGVPNMVQCGGCTGGHYVVGRSYKDKCEDCQGTGRVPIPWAEVMNVR